MHFQALLNMRDQQRLPDDTYICMKIGMEHHLDLIDVNFLVFFLHFFQACLHRRDCGLSVFQIVDGKIDLFHVERLLH